MSFTESSVRWKKFYFWHSKYITMIVLLYFYSLILKYYCISAFKESEHFFSNTADTKFQGLIAYITHQQALSHTYTKSLKHSHPSPHKWPQLNRDKFLPITLLSFPKPQQRSRRKLWPDICSGCSSQHVILCLSATLKTTSFHLRLTLVPTDYSTSSLVHLSPLSHLIYYSHPASLGSLLPSRPRNMPTSYEPTNVGTVELRGVCTENSSLVQAKCPCFEIENEVK